MKSYPEFKGCQSEKSTTKRGRFLAVVFLAAVMLISIVTVAQNNSSGPQTMDIGVARVDITPEGPIRLAGYASRTKLESEGVIHRLSAKALAFGTDAQGPSVFITVDLVGIPGQVTTKLAEQLSKKNWN